MGYLDKVDLPPYDDIMDLAKLKMTLRTIKYGNSWNTTDPEFDIPWWNKRLQGEVDELTQELSGPKRLEEALDVINIGVMIASRELVNHKFMRDWNTI